MIALQFARGFGLPAAASAIVLLSACGGDVVVRSGDAGAGNLPPAPEVRLGGDGAGGTARGAAAWRVFGHDVAESGDNRSAAFFSPAELARLSAAKMADAARNGSDAIDVEVGLDPANLNRVNQFTYRASWRGSNESWAVDSTEANASFRHPGNDGRTRSRAAQTSVKRWDSRDGWAAARLSASPSGGDFPSARDGDLYVAVATNAGHWGSRGLDSDWLATGMWAYVPDDGAADGHRFGVFAAGGDPIGQVGRPNGWNIISGLSGTATYAGPASGVWSSVSPFTGVRNNVFFEARASLTADFDATPEDGYGHLSGRVGSFTSAGVALRGNPTMRLRQAVIGKFTQGAGRATEGATYMGFNGLGYSGVWEAGFFGGQSPSRDGGRPTSVAGTFGATTVGGGATFIGAFAAPRSGQ